MEVCLPDSSVRWTIPWSGCWWWRCRLCHFSFQLHLSTNKLLSNFRFSILVGSLRGQVKGEQPDNQLKLVVIFKGWHKVISENIHTCTNWLVDIFWLCFVSLLGPDFDFDFLGTLVKTTFRLSFIFSFDGLSSSFPNTLYSRMKQCLDYLQK